MGSARSPAQNDLLQVMQGSHLKTEKRTSLTEEEIDFNDIICRKDDWDVQDYVSQILTGDLMESNFFQVSFMVLITASATITACETNPAIQERNVIFFSMFDDLIFAVFVWEIFLKWYYGFWIFWKDGWNILDFGIVLALFMGSVLNFGKGATILQLLRLIRTVRSLTVLRGLALVIQVIIHSIPDMANIITLLIIFMLVFSVFGVTLFGISLPNWFGNLAKAMYSLFICITQDGWMDIYSSFKQEGGALMYGGAAYFFIFLTSGAFIFANLLVAVVTTSLEEAMTKVENTHAIGTSLSLTPEVTGEEDSTPEVGTIHLEQVLKETTMKHRQKPVRCSALKNLTISTFEEFCLTVEAIQENLTEYKKIRTELNSIVEEVREILFNKEQEHEALAREKRGSLLDGMMQNDVALGKRGDILSTLITLEKGNLITSAAASPALYQKGAVKMAALKARKASVT